MAVIPKEVLTRLERLERHPPARPTSAARSLASRCDDRPDALRAVLRKLIESGVFLYPERLTEPGHEQMLATYRFLVAHGVLSRAPAEAEPQPAHEHHRQSEDDRPASTAWIPVASIPALVTQEQFDQVQAKLAQNQRRAARHNSVQTYLLRALVGCGHCRQACSGRSADPRYPYYACSGKMPPLRSSRTEKCLARFTPSRQLDALVWHRFCGILSLMTSSDTDWYTLISQTT